MSCCTTRSTSRWRCAEKRGWRISAARLAPPLGTTFEKAAETLQAAGFTYDFVSDRQVRRLRTGPKAQGPGPTEPDATRNGRITTEGGSSYRTIVLPSSRYVPVETVLEILELARQGATVVSYGGWPADVSGVSDLEGKRARYKAAIGAIAFGAAGSDGIREAVVGSGRILQGSDLNRLLARANVQREPMVDQGLQFARRTDAMGRVYFISNASDRALDGWVPLDVRSDAIVAFDPMTGRRGRLRARTSGTMREVSLQLPAGSSLIVAESPGTGSMRDTFDTHRVAGEPVGVAGPWTVRFLKGGPTLPSRQVVDRLVSWTTFGQEAEVFSGTAMYTATFPRPAASGSAWQLDLGRVAESARVRLNGRDLVDAHRRAVSSRARRVAVASDEHARGVGHQSLGEPHPRPRPARRELEEVLQRQFSRPSCREPRAGRPVHRGRMAPLESGLLGPVTLTPIAVVR